MSRSRRPKNVQGSRPPRSAASKSAAPKRRRSRRKTGRSWALWLPLLAAISCGVTGALLVWNWGTTPSAYRMGDSVPERQHVRIELSGEETPEQVAELLANAELLQNTTRFPWLKRLYHPFAKFEAGAHLLSPHASPREYIQLLARLAGRPDTRVPLPEGWDSFQMAQRLEQLGICPAEDFLAESLPHEGYLYPESYDFRLNSPAKLVVERLRKEADKRFGALFEKEAPALAAVKARYGLTPKDVITLASVVQKEAADHSEFTKVASVFLNRLSDETFRPLRMLQSDPTAGYGCKHPDRPPSCQGYQGRITASLLKDPANRYNTYKNPGLPPGPIGNPSVDAIHAVLHAPDTTYLFFVAPNGGKHIFTRTLEEHRAATKSAK